MNYFNDIIFTYTGCLEHYISFTKNYIPEPEHFWSLEFCTSGKMLLRINDSESVILDAPVVYWLTPNNKYDFGTPDGSPQTRMWINMIGPRAERIINSLEEVFPAHYVMINDAKELEKLLQKIITYTKETKQECHIDAVTLLEKVIAIILKQSLNTQIKKIYSCNNLKIQQLVDEILHSPFKEWDFRTIARKQLNMSYNSFQTYFKKLAGTSPYDHVLNCRMQAAVQKLMNENLQIKEVAYFCGFSETSSFTRLFKKKIGISPTEVRKISQS